MRILTTAIATVMFFTLVVTTKPAQGDESDAFLAGKHKLDALLFKAYDEIAELELAHLAGETPALELLQQQLRVGSMLKEASQQFNALAQSLKNGMKKKTIGEYVGVTILQL